jgi:5-formyltetrahydrofolate cyclo-ligase
MNSVDLKRAKRAARARVLAVRDGASPELRAEWSRAIADRFLELEEVARAKVVMAFWSFGSELDTAPLIGRLHQRGVTVVLPKIADGDLEARAYAPGDPVTETSFGAHEPATGEPIEPGRIDLVATPGVAFDRRGRRVGYGGGFYDRFLLELRPDAVRVGVCFSLQLVDGDLPGASFDLPVDVIVTESEAIRCAPPP